MWACGTLLGRVFRKIHRGRYPKSASTCTFARCWLLPSWEIHFSFLHAHRFFPYLPLPCFCQSTGEESVSDDNLLTSFYSLVDPFEADFLRECMSGSDISDDTLRLTVVPLLSRFISNKIPTSDNVKSIIPEVATMFALLVTPFFPLSEIRTGMLDAQPSFRKKCKNPNLT